MTKKDYQAIAAMMYRTKPVESGMVIPNTTAAAMLGTWYAILDGLLQILQADNSRFNRELFKEACETGRCRGMRQVA